MNFDQIQERAAREIETAQTQSNAELTDLRSRLETREQEYAVMIEVERALKSEIFALQSQLERNQAFLQSRDQEASADAERISVLEQELATAHAEAEKHDALRRADQDSIAELEHQVAIKERALSERQEAVSAVELALHGRIQTLQQELARNRNEIQQRDVELKSTQAEAETLRERIADLESARAEAESRAQELVETGHHRAERGDHRLARRVGAPGIGRGEQRERSQVGA